MFNPNEPIAEQLVINAEDLRPRVMTPTVTQPNPTTNLGGAMSTEFPSFGSDLSSGVQSFLTRMGSGTRADDYEDMRKASLQAAQLGIEGGIIHASGLAGGMLGQGLGKALGFSTPREAKKARIDEMMAQYPDPQTYEDYMAIAAGAKEIGELDLWEKAFNMAEKMKTTKTTSNPYLDAKRERNELALRLQQAYGNMDSLVDKKKFKQQLIDAGVGDSSVFTSVVGEINTLVAANLNQSKDTANRQEKLANQMIKNGVPEIESALVEFENLVSKHGGDLPGIGIDALSPKLEAKEMGSAFTQIKNMVLKERSGAAVTNPEFQRLIEEIKGAYYTTDADAMRWVSRIRGTLERVKGTIFSGYGSAVKEAYWKGDDAIRMFQTKSDSNKTGVIKWSDIK